MRIGDHVVPGEFVDDAFEPSYLDELEKFVMLHRTDVPSTDPDTVFAGSIGFDVKLTLAGLPFLTEVLGFPIDDFLDKAVDANCNAFLFNSVVMSPFYTATLKPPLQNFGIPPHFDQSLRNSAVPEYRINVETYARTVAVLYLTNMQMDGGELEVYNDTDVWYQISKDHTRLTHETEIAEIACQNIANKSTIASLRCLTSVTEKITADKAVARIKPRKGRLAHFDGQFMHGVRKPHRKPAGEKRKKAVGNTEWRASLVLEQYWFPKKIVDGATIMMSNKGIKKYEEGHGRAPGTPFYATKEVEKKFESEGRIPTKRGADGIIHHKYRECVERLRSLPAQERPRKIVSKCAQAAKITMKGEKEGGGRDREEL